MGSDSGRPFNFAPDYKPIGYDIRNLTLNEANEILLVAKNGKRKIRVGTIYGALFCLLGAAVTGTDICSAAPSTISQKTTQRKLFFPDKFSLGLIYKLENANERDLLLHSAMVKNAKGFIGPAKGTVTVPAGKHTMVYLYPSYELVSHPEVLDQVPPDTIQCLPLTAVSAMVEVDKLLPHIKRLTGLRRLEICGSELNDKQIGSLKTLTNLQSLDMGENMITGECCKDLPTLKNLEDLNVSYNQLKPETFVYIGQCEKLLWLDVSRTQLSDENLVQLANLQHLKFLGMKGAIISAKGLAQINKMRSLNQLDLRGATISIKDLAILKNSTLRTIDLPGGNYSKAEMKALRQALPNVNSRATDTHVDKDTATMFAPLH